MTYVKPMHRKNIPANARTVQGHIFVAQMVKLMLRLGKIIRVSPLIGWGLINDVNDQNIGFELSLSNMKLAVGDHIWFDIRIAESGLSVYLLKKLVLLPVGAKRSMLLLK